MTKETSAKSQTIVVWSIQWLDKDIAPSDELCKGEIAGFSKYLEGSDFYIGLTGSKRFDVADFLRVQATKQNKSQYIIEHHVQMKYGFRDRINGKTIDGTAIDEFELTKPVVEVRKKILVAWSKIVMDHNAFTDSEKIRLVDMAMIGDANLYLPISAKLFSQTVEQLPWLKNASSIIYPALPIAHLEWASVPIKLIAFKKESILKSTPVWNQQ